MAGFYVVSWALVLFYAVLAVGALWMAFGAPGPMSSPTPLFAAAFGLPAVLAILRALLTAGRAPKPRKGTVRVGRKESPELWETVTELAEAVGAPVPTEIRLTLDVNASVSEDTRSGLRVAGRRMEIGVPLLAGLRADEVRAVLCHELGHYARRHTRFAATVYRGSAALHAARAGIADAAVRNPVVAMYSGLHFRVLGAYAWLYDAVSLAVRRRQEFEADAAAARVAGPEAMASALTSVHVVGAAWADFRERFLDPMAGRGRTPDDPMRAFAAMLTDTEYGEALEEWRREQPEPRRTRLDSHPPTEARLAALAVLTVAGSGAGTGPRPGAGLCGEPLPEGVWRALLRPLGGRGPGQPWEEWLDDAVEVQAIGAAEDLRAPLALLGSAPEPSLDGVLGLLEAGRGAELTGALAATDWGTRQWGAQGTAKRAVGVLVGQALVTAGRASWSVRWASPGVLVTYDEEAREAAELSRVALTDRDAAARLRFQLVLCGANVTVPLERTGRVSRLRVPGPPREDGRRVGGDKRAVSIGGFVAAVVVGLVFFSTQFEEERPPSPVPTRTVEPWQPPSPVPTGPGVPGRPWDPLPRPDCEPGEIPAGGGCYTIEPVLPTSLLTPLPSPPASGP
ncbi:M48 family metallopeptidase [Streptomyces sp. WMMC897]|uniref:M48 family metallopeptidase n=1 Tax=Streptomyces sp. WMMC897 TaxID=3014782 RepID=UPI0022B62535|nr:M48 family metallopeptidase [Streptomyces sp. WMMC897]MCZ7414380.1 M48 family metalloprotease [Streptomyces sp. WMMC897]